MTKQRWGRVIALLLVSLFLIGSGFEFLSYWQMTKPGYVALGILLAAATLWITEAVPLFVTSLFVLFLNLAWLVPAMRSAGEEVDNGTFTSPFFSDIILLFLGGFVLSAGLHKLHVDRWLATAIMRRTGNSLPQLMLGIMAITAFLSMWLSNTATAAMMLALVLPIVASLPESDRSRQGLLLSIPFAANIGGLGTPIGSPPNAIAMQYLKQVGLDPGFGMWLVIGVPGVISMLLIAWLLLRRMCRDHAGTLQLNDDETTIEWSTALVVVLVTTLVTVAGWMTSGLHRYSSGTVALIPVLVLFATGILGVRDLRNLSWDVLILMGGGLCLGTAMSESGLAEWLVARLPVQGLSVFWLMVLFGGVACVMSSVMSNTATANLIMPILLGLHVDSLSPLLIGTAFACSLSMPLPVSTPPNAMAFSSQQLSVSDMIRPGLILTVLGVLLTFTAGYWWWGMVELY